MADTESDHAPILSEISPRDKPWDCHKQSSHEVAQMYFMGGEQARCERMLNCADRLQFALLPQEDDLVALRLKQARFCRQRHCPICTWRKAMMWRARVLRAMHPSFDKGKTRSRYILLDKPKARFLHLTLTVKNPPMGELRETCKIMAHAWQKMTQRKAFPAIGWIRALEVTREKKARAYPHPHLHCLLMVPTTYFTSKYLTKQEWIAMWKQALGVDYDPSISINVVKRQGKSKKDGDGSWEDDRDRDDGINGIDCGVIEVLKYDMKPEDIKLSPEWLVELTEQMRQVKSVTVGGLFKDYINEDDPTNFINDDDNDDGEDLSQYPQWWFGWREMVKHYQRTKVIEPPPPRLQVNLEIFLLLSFIEIMMMFLLFLVFCVDLPTEEGGIMN